MIEISSKLTPTTQTTTPPPSSNHNFGEVEEGLTDEIPLEQSNKRIYYIGMFLLIVVFIATAGVIYLRSKTVVNQGEESQKVQVVEDKEPVTTAAPQEETTSTTSLKRSEITLEILNGTGIPGEAGKVADTFKQLGYNIAGTGNAAETSGNKLLVNPDYKDQIDALLSDVKKELDIAASSGDLDKKDVTAQIILGN